MSNSESPDPATWPYYIDDPLVDQAAHRLQMETDIMASVIEGRKLMSGTCSCAQMKPTPPWDDYAVFEAHSNHMAQVQYSVRFAAAEKGTQES